MTTRTQRRQENLADGKLRPRGLVSLADVGTSKLSTERARLARVTARKAARRSRKANR